MWYFTVMFFLHGHFLNFYQLTWKTHTLHSGLLCFILTPVLTDIARFLFFPCILLNLNLEYFRKRKSMQQRWTIKVMMKCHLQPRDRLRSRKANHKSGEWLYFLNSFLYKGYWIISDIRHVHFAHWKCPSLVNIKHQSIELHVYLLVHFYLKILLLFFMVKIIND